MTSLGVSKWLRRFGVAEEKIVELDWTQSVTVTAQNNGEELVITALPTRHFSGRNLWDSYDTLWSSFVLKGHHHKIYFGADSGMWGGVLKRSDSSTGRLIMTMLEVGAYNEL